MKIFHILKYAMHGAGNVYATIDLACTQADHGHEVYICSSINEFDELLSEHGVQFIRIDQIGSFVAPMCALFQLYRTLRLLQPDIVHAHMIKSALLAAIIRPFLRFKLVTSVHNEFQRTAIAMGVGQRVIGVSKAVTRSMIQRGISASKMRTVLNGTLNSPRRRPPFPAPSKLQHPAIVTVGGMHPRKGIADLIEAYVIIAASFPAAHLYLIGSGPMEEDYRALARRASGTGITFCGHVADPRSALLAADVFVLASHAEPGGLVLSEAREAGCAIVATNVGGIPEMLSNGEAGLLVPPKRPDLLAEAVLRLLRNPSFMAQMRARSQLNLHQFTMDRVAAETDEVYRELLREVSSA